MAVLAKHKGRGLIQHRTMKAYGEVKAGATYSKIWPNMEFSFHIHASAGRTPVKGKRGKPVPLQAWSAPEGSRMLRLPDFMTLAQDGGKVFSLTHRPPLSPGNTPGTHFC
jgi:hypothetical protein